MEITMVMVDGTTLTGEPEAIQAFLAAQPTKQQAATTKHNEIMAHCHEKRMIRRETTTLGGLTKAERSALYAAHPECHPAKGESRTAEQVALWEAIVTAHKAATK